MLFAGIDGGATHTRVAVATDNGIVRGCGRGGPSNVDNVSLAEARMALSQALGQALQEAGTSHGPMTAAFFGMAGVVSEADRQIIHGLARSLPELDGTLVQVDHDIRIALAGSMPDDVGIVLIVGTGSSCYGRRADGRHHQTGWGYLLDDQGSSYSIGLEAMKAAVREFDGRGDRTTLTQPVLEHLGISSILEILHALHHRRLSIEQIAAFAPTVVKHAEEGDHLADQILRRGAAALADMVVAVAKRLDFLHQVVPVALVGGLVDASPFYAQLIEGTIRERLHRLRMVEASLPPVLGAVRLALQIRTVPITGEIHAALHASRSMIRS